MARKTLRFQLVPFSYCFCLGDPFTILWYFIGDWVLQWSRDEGKNQSKILCRDRIFSSLHKIYLTLLNGNTWRCRSFTFLTFDKRTRGSTIAGHIFFKYMKKKKCKLLTIFQSFLCISGSERDRHIIYWDHKVSHLAHHEKYHEARYEEQKLSFAGGVTDNGQSSLEMWVFRMENPGKYVERKVWFVVKAAGWKEGITSLLLVETLRLFGFHPELLQPTKMAKLWKRQKWPKNESFTSNSTKQSSTDRKGKFSREAQKTMLNDHTRYFRQNMTISHCSVAKSVQHKLCVLSVKVKKEQIK